MALDDGDIQRLVKALGPIIDAKIDDAVQQYHDANVAEWFQVFDARVRAIETGQAEFENRALGTLTALSTNEFFTEAWKRYIIAEADRLYAMEDEMRDVLDEPVEEPAPQKVVKKVARSAD